MTRVTLGKSRVRESRAPGSVTGKAEWLSYSTATTSTANPPSSKRILVRQRIKIFIFGSLTGFPRIIAASDPTRIRVA